MRPKRILVTGGAGFLGSHLCESLIRSGAEVIAIDNLFTGRLHNLRSIENSHRFRFQHHDVEKPFSMEVDEIYHLACPASPIHYKRNPSRTLKTAFLGTMNALEAARESRASILITSTSEVYGDPEQHPQTEAYWGNVNPIGPRSCYDEGKRAGEALAVAYAQQHHVKVKIARIFNTYGPRMDQDDGRVVSSFILQALKQEPLTVSGGSQTRSFCYVSDLIRGLVSLMAYQTEKTHTVMNLGNPTELTIRQLADQIIKLTAGISPSQITESPLEEDDPKKRKPDISLATKELGWSPQVSLEDGLLSTINYFRSPMTVR